jgi:hypothetical protein
MFWCLNITPLEIVLRSQQFLSARVEAQISWQRSVTFILYTNSAALDNIEIEAFACIFELSRPDLL